MGHLTKKVKVLVWLTMRHDGGWWTAAKIADALYPEEPSDVLIERILRQMASSRQIKVRTLNGGGVVYAITSKCNRLPEVDALGEDMKKLVWLFLRSREGWWTIQDIVGELLPRDRFATWFVTKALLQMVGAGNVKLQEATDGRAAFTITPQCVAIAGQV